MKVLILGGTGAMGRSLVQILSEQGIKVFVTSRRKQESLDKNIVYIQGDAHDNVFIEKLYQMENWDAIVDFMIYSTIELKERLQKLLNSTKQYIYLSSSRVYADSKAPITEESERLLDVCKDMEYMQTDEYALAKARQEDILINSSNKNWTIIRPYITYNTERLQLGVLEKEQWLYRALHGRTIIFQKDIAQHITTLTYGYNVAEGIAAILGEKKALGEIIQIAGTETMRWEEILQLYLAVIKKITGKEIKVCLLDDAKMFNSILNGYQIKYDRMYDRKFNSEKLEKYGLKKIQYEYMSTGLEKCLTEFLNGDRRFGTVAWEKEAIMDRISGERTPFHEIKGLKKKVKYFLYRYTPYFKFKTKSM